MARRTVVKKQDPDDEIPVEVLATEIVKLAKGMQALEKSRLSSRAILVLLKDATGLSFEQIRRVLAGLRDLEKTYVKKR